MISKERIGKIRVRVDTQAGGCPSERIIVSLPAGEVRGLLAALDAAQTRVKELRAYKDTCDEDRESWMKKAVRRYEENTKLKAEQNMLCDCVDMLQLTADELGRQRDSWIACADKVQTGSATRTALEDAEHARDVATDALSRAEHDRDALAAQVVELREALEKCSRTLALHKISLDYGGPGLSTKTTEFDAAQARSILSQPLPAAAERVRAMEAVNAQAGHLLAVIEIDHRLTPLTEHPAFVRLGKAWAALFALEKDK